jgi:nitrogenase molybdenum-iron protein alpha/beta subunit
MILGFKTQFVEKILNGSKIHTIRVDKDKRWQKGKKINFATGVRTKNYSEFKKGFCKWNQAVELRPDTREIYLGLNGKMNLLDKKHNEMFAKNDRFNTEDEFWEWFNEPFYGVVIHWTDFIYSQCLTTRCFTYKIKLL